MYLINAHDCTGCGTCLDYCLAGAITINDGVARIDGAQCTSCGSCFEICPQGAVHEVKHVPALYPANRAVSPSQVSQSPARAIHGWPQLARREKVAALTVLLPVLSRLALRMVGRLSPRGRFYRDQGSPGNAGGGRHRWRGRAFEKYERELR
ncbi:MAG: hypothetical protein A2W01_10850 [Candidatus Solincola sediminis]|uniref:4Fe-4S ferredoxin-type domain-containing protein n=1 Tax=Candidatus Solincola sediminis TaxID=1797199 RepID=A0A1F2WMA3_9ACTN|nr:MAG: hypothetical protein A2Y75_12210 [Candidatus Solincola sediminis]OFW61399.1 MAG: hypothetical protein A2W01_10850 [Candidatus Solincola sediminis]